ncbi:MAG: ATP-binding cassette domain-containing protein [Acidimicrobiia bacterium]|nr:ATP-binding cassette domain-containing protein [Acidimicrobiia bacterium]MDH4366472.1 ATP-binding cassette domain-containing protein [Acidimicrobiia bacterium]MDH5291921.1 ATP-binding cassette domain-containing protein [Acidimicrobiia bacterium]
MLTPAGAEAGGPLLAGPVLELAGVEVRVEGNTILTGVDWRVERGQHWVVLGPNGGGKSTLLRIASLALHPSLGTVRVLGHELGRVDVRPLRARIGLASTALAEQMRGSLSAEEVVRCGRFGALEPWWHRYEPADTKRAESLLAQVGLDGYGDRTMISLSSGERQRVMLARTLMPHPELVLLDEPTANLDFGGREDLIDALQQLAADPASPPTVLVIHRVEDIPASATHLLALRAAQVAAQGPIEATLGADLLSDLFGLPVHLHRAGARWVAYRDPSA